MPELLYGRGEILGGSGGKEGGNQAPERPAAWASGSCTRLAKLKNERLASAPSRQSFHHRHRGKNSRLTGREPFDAAVTARQTCRRGRLAGGGGGSGFDARTSNDSPVTSKMTTASTRRSGSDDSSLTDLPQHDIQKAVARSLKLTGASNAHVRVRRRQSARYTGLSS